MSRFREIRNVLSITVDLCLGRDCLAAVVPWKQINLTNRRTIVAMLAHNWLYVTGRHRQRTLTQPLNTSQTNQQEDC